MRRVLLAIDVGGSTSRAHLVDPAGRCLGQGRNRGGNPASNTPEEAAAAIISAAEAAVADAGGGPFHIAVALIALAGPQAHVALRQLEVAFGRMGLRGPIVFSGDLLAMFASVTAASAGYCVVAGTGAGVVRIRDGEIERVVDAAGWLLGDFGSGYWLGHEAARAVAAELDGRGEATALTPALLAALGIDAADTRQLLGRPAPLRHLIDAIYALRPIELARFAPLVVARPKDPVARRLVAAAERHLADSFALAFEPVVPGPIALGGGVISHLSGLPAALADVVRSAGALPDIRPVADGSVGAIVLALRALDIAVDEARLAAIAASVVARREEVAGRVP